MAGLLMTRFGLLMGGTTAGDGGTGGVGVQLDAAYAGAGHTLSNDDRTLVNTSGGSDYRHWVIAEKRLPGNHPVPFYWEFEANPAGPAEFNGYHGVVSQAQLDDPGDTFDSGENPVYQGSLGYRGGGAIWGNDGSRQTTSPSSYGAGDIVMMAFDPSGGGLWVGLNGTWENDPETDVPVEVSNAAGGDFWPVAQGREPDEGGTLRSLPGQFSYPLPSNCIALGETFTPESGVAVSSVVVWLELGGGADLSAARVEVWHELGGGETTSVAAHELWIEKDTT